MTTLQHLGNEEYGSQEYDALSMTKSKGVCFVTFDHGEINILDEVLVGELIRLRAKIEEDDDIRVVVFQSANPDYFLSHAHFPLLQKMRDEGVYDSDDFPMYSGLLEQFRKMPKVSIAKVEGRARGGGAEFILAMDMCFGAIDKAFFSQMEIIVGILPGGGGGHYLSQKLGRSRAMEICLGGGDYSAQLAERYGYINRALPAHEIGEFVDELAFRIASYSPLSIAHNKAVVNMAEDGMESRFVENNRLFAELVKDANFDNRIRTFLKEGGEMSSGEINDWAQWAKRLS